MVESNAACGRACEPGATCPAVHTESASSTSQRRCVLSQVPWTCRGRRVARCRWRMQWSARRDGAARRLACDDHPVDAAALLLPPSVRGARRRAAVVDDCLLAGCVNATALCVASSAARRSAASASSSSASRSAACPGSCACVPATSAARARAACRRSRAAADSRATRAEKVERVPGGGGWAHQKGRGAQGSA